MKNIISLTGMYILFITACAMMPVADTKVDDVEAGDNGFRMTYRNITMYEFESGARNFRGELTLINTTGKKAWVVLMADLNKELPDRDTIGMRGLKRANMKACFYHVETKNSGMPIVFVINPKDTVPFPRFLFRSGDGKDFSGTIVVTEQIIAGDQALQPDTLNFEKFGRNRQIQFSKRVAGINFTLKK